MEAVYRFAQPYMNAVAAERRFYSSALARQVWFSSAQAVLDPLFAVRETRFLSQLAGSNGLAELDLYLRVPQIRGAVLEVLNSDEFRVSLARTANNKSECGRRRPDRSDRWRDCETGMLIKRRPSQLRANRLFQTTVS